MEQQDYLAWLAELDKLSPQQRREAQRALADQPSIEAEVARLEALAAEERRCPHCQRTGAVVRGQANGLTRYYCKGCGKTFNALTGTPLARLRMKERWSEFSAGLAEGDTIAASAERCGVADSTAFRWRHRLLEALGADAGTAMPRRNKSRPAVTA